MRAVFMRKEPEIDTKEFQVEKVITLPSEQYAYFTQHLMKEHDFIKENVDLMYEKDGVWHCLLVAGEGMDEGVLVESEGSAYARYSAFVPFAQEIIRQSGHAGNADGCHADEDVGGKRNGRERNQDRVSRSKNGGTGVFLKGK